MEKENPSQLNVVDEEQQLMQPKEDDYRYKTVWN
jgi:hypothetical protein